MIRARGSQKVTGQEHYNAIRKAFRDLKEAYVTIGVHEDAGQYTKGSNPPSVVEVALWTEFGTQSNSRRAGVPAYHWISTTIDENASLINQWREEALSKIISGEWSPDKALQAIGFRIKTLLENKIRSNMPPENAPSTKAGKIADGVAPNTLIHTGLLLRSITYRVFLK